jgi:two-component system sensor histidine kinase/response regulator
MAERRVSDNTAFLVAISRELRAPMNGVLGLADLLSDTDLDDEQRRYVRSIRSSGEALLVLLNDLLDLSRVEAGELALEPGELDLRDLVETLTSSAAASRRGVRVGCFVAREVPERVCADGVRLRQVLKTLLGNALELTTAGEVTVRVELQSEDALGHLLRVTVRDTRPGIPEADLEPVFAKPENGDGPTGRQLGRTGVGLTVARHLVELMGGSIGVTSQVGQGSQLFFSLPVKRCGAAAGLVAAAAPDEQGVVASSPR